MKKNTNTTDFTKERKGDGTDLKEFLKVIDEKKTKKQTAEIEKIITQMENENEE